MAPWLDARIPVLVGADPQAGDAALVEAGMAPPPGVAHASFDPASPHPAGCACCVARSGAAGALDRLFLMRVRGDIPFFRRVVVVASHAGTASVAAALAADPIASQRYRPG